MIYINSKNLNMEAEIIYCPRFHARVVKLSTISKSLVPEEITNGNGNVQEENCLLVKVQCESPEDLKYIYLLVADILERCERAKVSNVVLCPYGHLNNKRGPKEIIEIIFNTCEKELVNQGKNVKKVHFGSQKYYGYDADESVLATSRRSYPYIKHFYTTKRYIKLVTNNPLPFFQEYQKDEAIKIRSLIHNYNTVIDIGCGYGRSYDEVKSVLFNKQYVGIENNQEMYMSAIKKTLKEPNHNVIFSDALKLSALFPSQKNTLALCLQNTIGVFQGSTEKFLQMLGLFLKESTNNACVSFLKQSSLATEGVSFYESIQAISGKIDYQYSELEKGSIKMTNGYGSRWYSIEEARELFSRHFNRELIIDEYEHYFFVTFK